MSLRSILERRACRRAPPGRSRRGRWDLPIPVKTTMNRVSVLESSTEPLACKPSSFPTTRRCGYAGRGNGTGTFSASKLFNRRVKTIVVRGTLLRSTHPSGQDFSANGRETLIWKLTLKRRG